MVYLINEFDGSGDEVDDAREVGMNRPWSGRR